MTPPPIGDGAKCVGKYSLFDSRDPIDHEEAKKLCAVCPEIVACLRNLHAVQNADKSSGGSPEGTWAGMLMGGSRRAPGRPRKPPPECGTESGYQRHRHYGEPVDEPCQKAHRDHAREAAHRRAREAS